MVQFYASKKSAYNRPDPILAAEQLELLQTKMKSWGEEFFCFNYLWILAKKKSDIAAQMSGSWNKRLIPYKLNPIQVDITNRRGKRNIIPKPRQVGLTTYIINNKLYVPSILEPGTTSMLISQTKGYGLTHFRILHRTHKYFAMHNPFNEQDPLNEPWRLLHAHLLHTQYSAKHELVFDMLDSRVVVDTAENTEVGQGYTLNRLACTEVPRWPHNPEETLSNAKEALEQDGTLDLEGNPNGIGDYFYEEFMRSLNNPTTAEFKALFYEWWWQPEYRKTPAIKESDLTKEEKELRKQANLDLAQITWRREKMISLRKQFKEKYPEDAISCFLSTGVKFFDEEACYLRYRELEHFKPFTESEDGTVVIFKRRVKGRRYIIGADVARGIQVTSEDTDYSAAKVIDEETGAEVARYHGRIAPEDFGLLLAELGHMYNDAMVAVERNGDGYTVMLALNQANYANIYRHRQWEDRLKNTFIELPGWPNNMVTRPIACNRLGQYIREASENIYDAMFLRECFTFTKNGKNGRPEGLPGTHDDTVFASAIAQYVRLVQMGFIDPLSDDRERYGETLAA